MSRTDGTTGTGAATPEEAYQRAATAVKAGDYAGLAAIIAPGTRAMYAVEQLLDALDEAEEDEALAERVEALLERHGQSAEKLEAQVEVLKEADEEDALRAASMVFPGVDPVVVLAEALALQAEHLEDFLEDLHEMFGAPALTEVEVEDEQATGQAGEEEHLFVRDGGGWYIALG